MQVFQFARLMNGVEGSNAGTALLCDYWKKCGKLDKLFLLIKNDGLNLKFEEIQYLVAAENCCEQLYSALDNFLREPYCSAFAAPFEADAETIADANELIKNLKGLKALRLKGSWREFFVQLSELAARIISSMERLLSSGKKFHFSSTVGAEQVLSGTANYDEAYGRYFLFTYKMS